MNMLRAASRLVCGSGTVAAHHALVARRHMGMSNLMSATIRRKYLKSLNKSMPATGVSAKEWSRRAKRDKLLEPPDPRRRIAVWIGSYVDVAQWVDLLKDRRFDRRYKMVRGYVKRHLDLKIGLDRKGTRVELECGTVGRCRAIYTVPNLIPGTRTELPEGGMPDDGLMPGTEHLREDKSLIPIPNWDPETRQLAIPPLPDFLSDGTTPVENVFPPPPTEATRFCRPV